jgi:hypothetical protein
MMGCFFVVVKRHEEKLVGKPGRVEKNISGEIVENERRRVASWVDLVGQEKKRLKSVCRKWVDCP